MPFRTKLTEMLGIEHPVVMGGLTGAGTPKLAAAVSNAGGCGFVCAHTSGDPAKCVEWLMQMDSLTNKPWGVNLTILRSFKQASEYLDAIIAFGKVSRPGRGALIIETAGRNPAEFIPKFKRELPDCIIIHKCTSVRHSLSAVKHGADIISLDGFECAGRPPLRAQRVGT
jgi:nitronate monooxygenase